MTPSRLPPKVDTFTLFAKEIQVKQVRIVGKQKKPRLSSKLFVTPARFEPATATFVVWYSIQLSYGAIFECKYTRFFLYNK